MSMRIYQLQRRIEILIREGYTQADEIERYYKAKADFFGQWLSALWQQREADYMKQLNADLIEQNKAWDKFRWEAISKCRTEGKPIPPEYEKPLSKLK